MTADAESVRKLSARAVVKPALRAEVLERARRLRVWRVSDFHDLPPLAVAQALSRLVRRGVLVRIAKGAYIVPVEGFDGVALHRLRMYAERSGGDGEPGGLGDGGPARRGDPPVFPSGLTAAHSLGLTNQNAAVDCFSTPAASVPIAIRRLKRVEVTTRRPEVWRRLQRLDGATLELLRDRGRWIEFDEGVALATLARAIRAKGRWRRLLEAAPTEPPRVRAMLGAIAEHASVGTRAERERLRASLNPLSKFDFGYFRCLPNAGDWHCRHWKPISARNALRRTARAS